MRLQKGGLQAGGAFYLLAAVAGCRISGGTLEGRVKAMPVMLGVKGQEPWGRLAFDDFGNLSINGQVLSLPIAQENRRFGLSFVDASALPRAWRPAHASEGGLMVSSIELASPLAIAGLRPFDVVVALEGEPAVDGRSLATRLQQIAPGRDVRLEALTPRGPGTFRVKTPEALRDSTRFNITPLFYYGRSPLGFSVILPGAALAWSSWIYDGEPKPENDGPSPAYYRQLKWEALLGIFSCRTTENLYTGKKKRRLDLFKFKLAEWDLAP